MLKRVKFFIRTHMGRSLWSIYVDMRYMIRNLNYVLHFSLKRAKIRNVFYFIIQPGIYHPGLADRFKAIIGAYYIAKKNNYEFKLIYKIPFRLEDYLKPNKINWIADFKELDYSLIDTRMFNYSDWHGIRHLKRNKQYHCINYIGNDALERYVPNSKKIWRELFNELFTPTDILRKEISKVELEEKKYISIHLRFVNALENFEIGHYNYLNQEKKNDLIKRCVDAIMKIYNLYGDEYPIYCFSDSSYFLNCLKDSPIHYLDSSNVGHINFNHTTDNILKTFLDFYLLSKSKIVYRIMAPEMYSSTCFSYYASIMGDADFREMKV